HDVEGFLAMAFLGDAVLPELPVIAEATDFLLAVENFTSLVLQRHVSIARDVVHMGFDGAHTLAAARNLHHDFWRFADDAFHSVACRDYPTDALGLRR